MNFVGIHHDGCITCVAGAALAEGKIVKWSSGKVVACTAATDEAIGVTLNECLADEEVGVKLLGSGGTVAILAGGEVAQGAQLTPKGEVATLATDKIIGRALNAASAAGDPLEVVTCVVRTTIAAT